MKRVQIYKNGRAHGVYALVSACGNYSVNTKSEVIHGFTNFRQGSSWTPIASASAPGWLAEQIDDFDLYESDEA